MSADARRPLEERLRRRARRRTKGLTPYVVAMAALIAGLVAIVLTRGSSLLVPAVVAAGAVVVGGIATWVASRVEVVVGADGIVVAAIEGSTFVPFSELERCYVGEGRLRIHARTGILTLHARASVLDAVHGAALRAFRAGEDGALVPRAPLPEVVSYRASARQKDALWALLHDDFAPCAARIDATKRVGSVDREEARALVRIARRTAHAGTREALEKLAALSGG